MSPPQGRLEGYIFKDEVKKQVYVRKRPEPGAKTAVTGYRTLASRDGLSLVECNLITGFHWQIASLCKFLSLSYHISGYMTRSGKNSFTKSTSSTWKVRPFKGSKGPAGVVNLRLRHPSPAGGPPRGRPLARRRRGAQDRPGELRLYHLRRRGTAST